MNLIRTTLVTTTLFMSLSIFTAHHESISIGDVEMNEVEHSEAFKQMSKMIGKWEGKLTQYTGSVIDTSSEFRMVSGGNTITESLVEDGVEMLTTYTDQNGKLVVKHYCALGTQPIFTTSELSSDSVEVQLVKSLSDYHPEHHSYVNSMKWTAKDKNNVVVDSTIYLEGELQVQQSVISRVN